MGRPLFSGVLSSGPAIRAEPQAVYPTYEKWTHWNAFDPDADEFFESDDAVYEAFVDPADLRARPESRGEDESDSSRSSSPLRISSVRSSGDAVVIDDGSSLSSGSSEGSDSGRESPMSGPGDDEAAAARSESGTYVRGYIPHIVRVPAYAAEPTVEGVTRTRTVTVDPPADPADNPRVYQPGEMVSQYANMFNIVSRSGSTSTTEPSSRPSSASPGTGDRSTLTRTSDITPIFVRIPPDRRPTLSPSPRLFTPPPPPFETPMTDPFVTPSPPPTVTPRLYTWSSRPLPASPTPAPSTGGPLTNPSARMSLAHIAPSRAEARHIVI